MKLYCIVLAPNVWHDEHNANSKLGLPASFGFKAVGAFCVSRELQTLPHRVKQLSGPSIIYCLLPSGNSWEIMIMNAIRGQEIYLFINLYFQCSFSWSEVGRQRLKCCKKIRILCATPYPYRHKQCTITKSTAVFKGGLWKDYKRHSLYSG